jgi:Raf kinase inhibitor-like YbhB/YbcL family protein
MRRIMPLGSLAAALLISCGRGASTESALPENPSRRTLRFQSPAFAEGGPIPRVHTCDGKNTSPPLSWSGVPEGTRSLALICEDPDAPVGTFSHWVLFDLPPDLKGLDEAIPPEREVKIGSGVARQGQNDFGKVGYGGPCPPGGTHHYLFRLYAIDARPAPGPEAGREGLLRALKGHVLAEGRLVGTYSR